MEIEKNRDYPLEDEDMEIVEEDLIKEPLTEEQLNDKRKRTEEIVDVLMDLLAKEELDFLSFDSIGFRERMSEAYRNSYPSLMSDGEIKEKTEIIFSSLRDSMNKNSGETLENHLITEISKIVFVDEDAYVFNTKMISNIPLLLENPTPFKKHENYVVRAIIWLIMLVNFKAIDDLRIGEVDMKIQLLARYHRNLFEFPFRRFFVVLGKSRTLDRKDKYKFLIGLDRLLFPDGNYMSKISSHEGLGTGNRRRNRRWYAAKIRREKLGFFCTFLFLLVFVLLKTIYFKS